MGAIDIFPFFLLFIVTIFITKEGKCVEIDENFPEATLELVICLFRHGERIPHPDELYPNDPYLNYSYPVAVDALTAAGDIREYKLGKSLRRYYDSFLAPVYTPDLVISRSTDMNRTKMSLELVLAGLFFPVRNQSIPYSFIPETEDKELVGILSRDWLKLYYNNLWSVEVQKELAKQKDVFEYISESTGKNFTLFLQCQVLYFGLTAEEDWGLKLPPWTEKVWPEILTDLAIKEYFVQASTTDMLKYGIGYFFKEIITHLRNKIAGETPITKMFLYSAHDFNIAYILIALNLFDEPFVPPYGCYLSFDLYKIGQDKYGIKMFLQNNSTPERRILKLPGCGTICEFEKFVLLVDKYIPKGKKCRK